MSATTATLPQLVARWEPLLGSVCATAHFVVEAEQVRRYCRMFGYDADRFHSSRAAVAEGFRDLVAPAAYAGVYSHQAGLEALHSPELGVPFAWNLHAAQSLELAEPVCAGDDLTTTVTLAAYRERGRNLFFDLATRTTLSTGELCATGVSTHVVRFP